LTPHDPHLKGARYPGGFNPRAYQVKIRFQNVPFKRVNLRRYGGGDRADVFEMPLRCLLGDVGGRAAGVRLVTLNTKP
jgi:hypothetical protein